MPRKYLGNSNTKEIHEFVKMDERCKLREMKEEHKFWLDTFAQVMEHCRNKGYNGCAWCMPQIDTDGQD